MTVVRLPLSPRYHVPLQKKCPFLTSRNCAQIPHKPQSQRNKEER